MRSCFLDGADLAPDNVRGFCLLPMQMRVAHEFGAGHDVYFYFIASVILPLSKIWKLKSYLSYIPLFQRAVSIAVIVQNMKLDREPLESLYF